MRNHMNKYVLCVEGGIREIRFGDALGELGPAMHIALHLAHADSDAASSSLPDERRLLHLTTL
ncbi:hypothetical protein FVER14953_21719 [Fusarium verticillioides]|nr:hypothetical protein FVER14953_21719 [Fusarium verticillioides]